MLSQKYLKENAYFGKFWHKIDDKNRKDVIEMLVPGKELIPYGKIRNFHIIYLRPENRIFAEEKHFSELKDQATSNSEYENAKLSL